MGPSSSHTLGPWKAASHFLSLIDSLQVNYISIELYGSLSKTGKGHGTDVAIIMGLSGYDPEICDTSQIDIIVENTKLTGQLTLKNNSANNKVKYAFIFQNYALSYHPNGMKVIAELTNGEIIEQVYYSIGGGFIEVENENQKNENTEITIPYPIENESELETHLRNTKMPLWKIVLANELVKCSALEVQEKIEYIWETMLDSMYRGCHTSGVLPGGLNVKRRAQEINKKLLLGQDYKSKNEWVELIKKSDPTFNNINQWISCFALSVNEENAAFGRIVTSPTNGAAGIIPAVFMYYFCFDEFKTNEEIMRFFLTASEIGSLFKKGATISAAAGGCQAEIGVSAAMAAAALTELKGGNPQQVLMAAEIAMEHHLGLTCDPVGGLVQIPCIERNAIGAMKAISASNLALNTDPSWAKVKLDDVIKTMWQTAKDMNLKYRETSEGGLAINISAEILPNC